MIFKKKNYHSISFNAIDAGQITRIFSVIFVASVFLSDPLSLLRVAFKVMVM